MTLREALEAVGVGVAPQGQVEVPTVRSYNNEREHVAAGSRDMLLAQFGAFRFLVVPLTLYLEGDIAEEWCVSAGSPPTTPRTILRLRDGQWVFLGRERDPSLKKWPTIPFDGVFRAP